MVKILEPRSSTARYGKREDLVTGFLGDPDATALGYAEKVQRVMAEAYKGFTLVVGDGEQVCAICNRGLGNLGSGGGRTTTGTSATAASSRPGISHLGPGTYGFDHTPPSSVSVGIDDGGATGAPPPPARGDER